MVRSVGGRKAVDPRIVLRAAVCLGISLAAVAVVVLESASGALPFDTGTPAERKMQLHSHMQSLLRLKIGGTTIGDTGVEAGNLGAYWNYGQNFGGKPDTNPSEHDGGSGAFGKWGVESVEPSGEAYDVGQQEAETAFIAYRRSSDDPAGGDDEDAESSDELHFTPAKAPWLDSQDVPIGEDKSGGNYLGAGEIGSEGAHAEYQSNADGARYDNGCDRAVAAGCVGVIKWVKGSGRHGNRDLGLNDEPVPIQDPANENVQQAEPYEEVQEVLSPTESATKATADAVAGSRLRAVTNEHVTHSPESVEDDSNFWEELGRSTPLSTSLRWSAHRSKSPDPDAPSQKEAARDKPHGNRHHVTSRQAEHKREKMIQQVDEDVRKIFRARQQGPDSVSKSAKRVESGSERGRQGETPLEKVEKRIQDRTDERATNPLADLAQREQKIEAQLKQENQLLLGDLKNWGSSK